jgi:hypothetical protein
MARTPVATILLTTHQSRWDEEDEWRAEDDATVLSHLSDLNAEALAAFRAQAPWVQLLSSKTAQETYWGNACTTCQALQGDWHLHEPDAPFFPQTQEQEAQLTMTWHEVPIEANADGAQASWMDRLVERFPHD